MSTSSFDQQSASTPVCSRSTCPTPSSCDEYGCRYPTDRQLVPIEKVAHRLIEEHRPALDYLAGMDATESELVARRLTLTCTHGPSGRCTLCPRQLSDESAETQAQVIAQGLADCAAGRVGYLGSFERYAPADILFDDSVPVDTERDPQPARLRGSVH